MVTTAYPTRDHGHMVWDALYGLDEQPRPHPQLAERHVVEDDGKRWVFTARQGPTFHDGEMERAKDAVASIKRWVARDAHGQTLAQRLTEICALDDRRFEIRLNRPFGPMLDALGKPSSYPCFIMPGRLAQTDSATAIPEVIGSGPYRLVPEERVVGSRIVYCYYDRYVPREGTPSMTSGPKHAHFERMEGHIITDAATSAAALQTGEIDWWSAVPNDLRPIRQRNCDVMMDVVDTFVLVASLRPNHLHPPFNNPAKRRALLPAITQADFMQSIIGNDRTIWRDGVGCFPVNSPMASDEGIGVLTGPRDTDAAKRVLLAAGYKGETVVFLDPINIVNNVTLTQVAIDMMRTCGLTVDDATTDWGTLLQRRARKEPPGQGG
jgi:peptide/nickel transport system substrate-binding protein